MELAFFHNQRYNTQFVVRKHTMKVNDLHKYANDTAETFSLLLKHRIQVNLIIQKTGSIQNKHVINYLRLLK